MKVQAFVKPGRKTEWLAWDGQQLVASVNAPPVEGSANQRLAKMVAEFLHLSKTEVQVVKGFKSRHKTLEIAMDEAEFAEYREVLPTVPRQDALF